MSRLSDCEDGKVDVKQDVTHIEHTTQEFTRNVNAR